jgi:hypothetical protein
MEFTPTQIKVRIGGLINFLTHVGGFRSCSRGFNRPIFHKNQNLKSNI